MTAGLALAGGGAGGAPVATGSGAAAYPALTAAPGNCADALAHVDAVSRERSARALACLISGERTLRGLPAPRRERRLANAGSRFAQRMVDGVFFSHVEPDGRVLDDRLRESGYSTRAHRYVLENLVTLTAAADLTPALIINEWMSSEAHRENMLDPSVRDVGIGLAGGYADGGGPGITAVALLGRRRTVTHR